MSAMVENHSILNECNKNAVRPEPETYIDTPELLHRVKSDNLFQKVIPVITLDKKGLALHLYQ